MSYRYENAGKNLKFKFWSHGNLVANQTKFHYRWFARLPAMEHLAGHISHYVARFISFQLTFNINTHIPRFNYFCKQHIVLSIYSSFLSIHPSSWVPRVCMESVSHTCDSKHFSSNKRVLHCLQNFGREYVGGSVENQSAFSKDTLKITLKVRMSTWQKLIRPVSFILLVKNLNM